MRIPPPQRPEFPTDFPGTCFGDGRYLVKAGTLRLVGAGGRGRAGGERAPGPSLYGNPRAGWVAWGDSVSGGSWCSGRSLLRCVPTTRL